MRVVDGMRGFAGLVEGEVGGELAEVWVGLNTEAVALKCEGFFHVHVLASIIINKPTGGELLHIYHIYILMISNFFKYVAVTSISLELYFWVLVGFGLWVAQNWGVDVLKLVFGRVGI
jgi:hypothetical protein